MNKMYILDLSPSDIIFQEEEYMFQKEIISLMPIYYLSENIVNIMMELIIYWLL